KCRFKKQVVPGDTLMLEVEITKIKGPIGKGSAKATVDGQLACSCELTFAIQDA
ncbi:MAG: 3-hydroxyacyl-[acyl-carrier-protein] dehydratase FabZ, partial [Staphylococcus sp.]|nr:3-hydroxyacyl-[acyl-carrier-protein] dehydratase FabZ [Staphylococcus sp.]